MARRDKSSEVRKAAVGRLNEQALVTQIAQVDSSGRSACRSIASSAGPCAGRAGARKGSRSFGAKDSSREVRRISKAGPRRPGTIQALLCALRLLARFTTRAF
jgi:hypothetical protein